MKIAVSQRWRLRLQSEKGLLLIRHFAAAMSALSAATPALAFSAITGKPHLLRIALPLFTTSRQSLSPSLRSSIAPHFSPTPISPNRRLLSIYAVTQASSENDPAGDAGDAVPLLFEERPLKFLLWVAVWASLSLAWFAASGDANAAADSIGSSSFGLKFAGKLRSFGWPDEAVVFALATLPVIELRGAIPVGYWMQLKPLALTGLAVLGNMVPVPLIILYMKKLATFLAGKNRTASRILELLFKRAKEKAGPVEEFQWLGLMLFVAVPFPGTGAWTGAIIASILDMPFWSAMSANFFGVVLAGLLVNLLVNLGLKYAIVTGIGLFLVSTFMWSILRSLKKSLGLKK